MKQSRSSRMMNKKKITDLTTIKNTQYKTRITL